MARPVISDALMPKMDGFQFLRKIKIDPALRTITFIFYSSVYTGPGMKTCQVAGRRRFVVKPKEPEDYGRRSAPCWNRASRTRCRLSRLDRGGRKYLNEYSHIVTMKIEEKIRNWNRPSINWSRREKIQEPLHQYA
jgi:CheY-like chemotaxis protein